MEPSLLVKENEKTVHLSLNRPRKLNVLNDEIIYQLKEKLVELQNNPQVKVLFLSGEGDKGFCAGGDVVNVVNTYQDFEKGYFFKLEYEVDQMIHHYPKPIIAFCNGITMGGGVGLVNGAKLKIFDPKTILAMPEISIGFFPDVGSSYFLNRLEKKWCLFLALTGARVSSSLANHLGLCDFIIDKGNWSQVMSLSDFNEQVELAKALHYGPINSEDEYLDLDLELDKVSSMSNIEEFDQWAQSYSQNRKGNPWILESLQLYLQGSPLSAKIIWEYFTWARDKTLEQCFEMDLSIGRAMLDDSDFLEGVRAQLIDKDKRPNWKFKTLQSISEETWNPYARLIKG